MDNYTNCTQLLSEVKAQDRIKENVIKELNNDVYHAQQSVESAKTSRTQEIGVLQQTIHDLSDTLQSLQNQYDQSLEKILTQSTVIRELEEKVSDYEYVASRNLRGVI